MLNPRPSEHLKTDVPPCSIRMVGPERKCVHSAESKSPLDYPEVLRWNGADLATLIDLANVAGDDWPKIHD